VAGQGAGDRHALLLPAGQLRRIAVQLVGQADERQAFLDPGGDLLALGRAMDFQWEGDVVEDAGVLQQVELLENHADILARVAQFALAQARQFASGHGNGAAVGTFEQVNQAQQGRFAGAALADQAENITGIDFQRDRFDRVELFALGQREGLVRAIDANHRRTVWCGHAVFPFLLDRDRLACRGQIAQPVTSVA